MIASTKDPTVGTTARSSRPTLGVVGSTLLATIGLLTQPAGPCLAAPTSPTRLQRSPQRTVDIQVWSDDRIEPTSPHLPVGISDWPAFVAELKRFCFAGTDSDNESERRRAIRARLMCLGYFTGWMLNLPSADILQLIEAADRVQNPAGPHYAWTAEMFAT